MISRQIILAYIHKILYFIIMPIQISLYTNALSVEDYGLLNLIVNTSVMLTVLFSFGLHSYSAITIPKYNYNRQLYIFTNILKFEIISFSLLYFIFILIIHIFNIINLTLLDMTIIFVTYLFFLVMNELGRFYSYRHKIEVRFILSIAELIITISILYFINKYLTPLTIRIIMMSYLCVYIFITFIYLFILHKKIYFCKSINYKLIKNAMIFSIPLIFADLTFKLMQNIDSYFLLYYKLQYDLGIYSFIIKVTNTLYLLSSPILWIFYPYLVKYFQNEKIKFNYFLDIQLRYTGLITVLGLGLFIINIEFFINVIATPKYIENKYYFYIVSFYPLELLYLYSIYQILMIEKKKNIILKSYILGLCINTLFSFILIDKFGIYGAFISTILGLLTIIIVMLININSSYRLIFLKYILFYLSYIICIILLIVLNLPTPIINVIFILSLGLLIIYLNIHKEIYLYLSQRKKL